MRAPIAREHKTLAWIAGAADIVSSANEGKTGREVGHWRAQTSSSGIMDARSLTSSLTIAEIQISGQKGRKRNESTTFLCQLI